SSTAPPTAALLSAVSPAELAGSSFWEYLSQVTSDKESPEHGQGSKLGRDMTSLKERDQDGGSCVGNLLEKLGPLSRGGQPPRLQQDSASLRELLRRELQSLRAKLSPYVDDVHRTVGRHLEELRSRLQPLTEELLDQVSLKARELRRRLMPGRGGRAQLLGGAEEAPGLPAPYAATTGSPTGQGTGVFQPHAQRLLAEIHRGVEELHRGVAPHARASPQQLARDMQELSAQLAQNARDLHHQIQGNLEQLQARLSLYPGGPQQSPASAQRLAREVQRRVEEFRRDTYVQIQDFTRAIDRETEEMRLKLSSSSSSSSSSLPSRPGDSQEGPPALEDLHARLDALWTDLAHSLSERGGEGR
ncbi:APOA5 protein, partial [Rostratula benghalensis]|nr:APOA5 protein [Rostratula benghalensis]